MYIQYLQVPLCDAHVTLWWLSVWASSFRVPQTGALHWCPRLFVERSFCWLWRSFQWWEYILQAVRSPAVMGSWVSPTGAALSSVPAQGCRDGANTACLHHWLSYRAVNVLVALYTVAVDGDGLFLLAQRSPTHVHWRDWGCWLDVGKKSSILHVALFQTFGSSSFGRDAAVGVI